MGRVSHDLCNLLNTIVLNATVVAERTSASDEGRFAALTTR